MEAERTPHLGRRQDGGSFRRSIFGLPRISSVWTWRSPIVHRRSLSGILEVGDHERSPSPGPETQANSHPATPPGSACCDPEGPDTTSRIGTSMEGEEKWKLEEAEERGKRERPQDRGRRPTSEEALERTGDLRMSFRLSCVVSVGREEGQDEG